MGRDKWVVLAAFLGGILLANLLDRQLLVTYGILNDYFLSRYTYQSIDRNRLFCYVFMERCKAAFLIFLLGRAVPKRAFPGVLLGAVAAGFGFLVTVAIFNLGMWGIVICLGGLLPQWLFYLAAITVYVDDRRQALPGGMRREWPAHLLHMMLAVLLLMLGILTEGYINPVLLGYILKVF